MMHRCSHMENHMEEPQPNNRDPHGPSEGDGRRQEDAGWIPSPEGSELKLQTYTPEEHEKLQTGRLHKWSGEGSDVLNCCETPSDARTWCEESEWSSGLQPSLQHSIDWLSLKEEELAEPLPLVGDVAALQQQREEYQVFVEEVKSRGPLIFSVLESAQDFLTQSSLLETEEDFIQYDHSHGENSVQWVWRQAGVVAALWERLMGLCTARHSRMEAAVVRLAELQSAMAALNLEVQEALGVQEAWEPLGGLLVDSLQDHIDAIKLFEEELAPLREAVRQINELAQQLSMYGVQLTTENTQLLQHLNHQCILLQISIDDRLRDLQEAHRCFGPKSQHFLSGSVQPPWERSVSPNKVPYYINHETQTTSWDHPKMIELYQAMANLNHIRFSAYRTAMKLHCLQKCLRLSKMSLGSVVAVCPRSEPRDMVVGLTSPVEVMGSGFMDVLEVIHALGALYASKEVEQQQELNVPLCVDLCLNWLLSVYDSGRTGRLHALSFKTGLVCLCQADIKDKCKFLFQEVSGADGRTDAPHLASLLQELMQIPRQLGEVAAFGGSNVEPSVASCFRMAPGRSSVGSSDFLEWMSLEPQSLVWLPLLQRVALAEHTLHHARCSVCKHSPIRGFRYRSLKQFNVDICQACFLSGRASKGKTLHYPIIEYYTPSTSGERIRDFAETLKNKFRSKDYFSRHPQRGYLALQSALGPERDITPSSSPKFPHADTHSRIEHFANSIISQKIIQLAQMEKQSCSFFSHSLDEDQYPVPHSSHCSGLSSPHLPRNTGKETQEELQQTLVMLEQQNRILQAEYRRLRWQYTEAEASPHLYKDSSGSPRSSGGQEVALLAEAKVLRQHKGRLETRMQILEDHNRQLESQLQRLRKVLLQSTDDSESSESMGSTCTPKEQEPLDRGPSTTDTEEVEMAAHQQDQEESDTASNLQQVIEQLRTSFQLDTGEGDFQLFTIS
ncbi:dystrophin-related protein 2-like isoform X2 [Denticeps clupeoides]|uniref:dystrophin-related protein 2-like isoform X2 n=1 Tax=Denticeps clupeoides TaxID=299321 RepID=UPI0010A412AC|nr:dystrophin-related protein 2-like isoform X2 [Denticeps clupeoides]